MSRRRLLLVIGLVVVAIVVGWAVLGVVSPFPERFDTLPPRPIG